jgi:putative ABC transport system permease protein
MSGGMRGGMDDASGGKPAPRAAAGPSLSQLLFEASHSLRTLSQRALLTMLGTAIGSAAIVALLSLGRGAAEQSLQAFEAMGSNTAIANLQPASDGAPVAQLDIAAAQRALPAIAELAPLALLATRVRSQGLSAEATIVGSNAAMARVAGLRMQQGRFISDFDQRAAYAVVGSELAATLGIGAAWQGRTIQINQYLFTLVGVLAPQAPNPLLPVAFNQAVMLSLPAMQRLQGAPQMSNVVFQAQRTADIGAAAEQFKAYCAQHYPKLKLEVQLPLQLLEGMRGQARNFSYLLAALGGIALLVSGIGIMNVMLMSIAERRKEIGIRLSLGARQRDIRHLFLLEAVGLSIGGAVGGVLLGLLAVYLYAGAVGWRFHVPPDALLVGLAAPILVGVVFGLFPAIQAARLQPLQVLRDE